MYQVFFKTALNFSLLFSYVALDRTAYFLSCKTAIFLLILLNAQLLALLVCFSI